MIQKYKKSCILPNFKISMILKKTLFMNHNDPENSTWYNPLYYFF